MAAARTLVMDAVEQLNFRVTLGDVASSTGLALPDAQRELLSLAQVADGHMQVSDQGEIAYAFAKTFRRILEQKLAQDQQRLFREQLWRRFLYGLRISFGVLLIASIVIISLALIALAMASQSSDNNRRRDGGGFIFIPNLWYGNPFWGSTSYGTDRSRGRGGRPAEKTEMNFLEAVYSFLFGDGNPNEDLQERRYSLIATTIRNHEGVITGEQVLPYLDLAPQSLQLDYEDFMLPILVKFNGQPEVSDRGDIVYRFPDLQVTAEERSRKRIPAVLQERFWKFSRATSGQLAMAGGLGVLNFVLASFLFGLRGSVAAVAAQGNLLLALVNPLVGILMIYGTLFLAVPGIRWFALQRRNQQVEIRNAQRQNWLERLKNPTDRLLEKLNFARGFAKQEVVSTANVIYSTNQDLLEQDLHPELESPEMRKLLEKDPQQPPRGARAGD
jgi:hypothetical protein